MDAATKAVYGDWQFWLVAMLHSNINERQRWKWYIWVAMLHRNINERQSWYIIYADTVYIGIAGWRQEVQRNTTEKYRRMQRKKM